LKLLVGDPVTETETVAAQRLVDYVSLILNQNVKFFMFKDAQSVQLPLFSDPNAPVDLGLRQYRINGDTVPLYLKIGTSSEVNLWLNAPDTIGNAFNAYSFDAQRHNLYNYADEGEVKGLLFSTDFDAQSPRKKGSEVFFPDGLEIDDFEILSVCEITELF